MRKIALIFLITLFYFNRSYSQVAYYDATTLSKMLDNNNHFGSEAKSQDQLFTLLNKRYGVDTTDFVKIKSDSTFNPFLYNFFDHSGAAPKTKSLNLKVLSGVFESTSTAIGNANVTSVAGGVTSFLVKRAKEELLISIIDKLKDPTKFPEFPILFPNTMKLMENFDSWEYANVLNTLKEAFDKDLQQLLGDIPKLNTIQLNSKLTYSNTVKNRVNVIKRFLQTKSGRIFISVMQVGNGVVIGEKVPDIIHTIADTSYLGNVDSAAGKAIRFVDIISYSLRNANKGNYISKGAIDSLWANPILQKIYLGLIYQQMLNDKITFPTLQIGHLRTTLNSSRIITYLDSLTIRGVALNTAMDSLSNAKKKNKKDLSTYWADVLESTNQLLITATNLTTIDLTLKFPPQVQTVVQYSSKSLDIAHDIFIRNYSAAVLEITFLTPDDPTFPEFKKYFVKYGSFAANLVQAQTADDAENAIEAVALPVGSYTVKQNATTNISVNGYVGYGRDGNYASGIYAPIGFSLSKQNFLFWIPWHVPTTLFVPLFDVGSIATYQLNNPSTTGTSSTGTATTTTTINTSSSNQQIKLSSLFAPGAELFFEIPRLPFAFGTGMRRTPTLSYSSGSTYNTVGARWQWNFAVLIDIPIFTLFSRSKD